MSALPSSLTCSVPTTLLRPPPGAPELLHSESRDPFLSAHLTSSYDNPVFRRDIPAGQMPLVDFLGRLSRLGHSAFIERVLNELKAPAHSSLGGAVIADSRPIGGAFPLTGPDCIEDLSAGAFPSSVLERWARAMLETARLADGRSLASAPTINQAPRSTLNILTLNVWGVPGITNEPARRFGMIAERLRAGPWDVVNLQEMWDPRAEVIIQESGFPFVVREDRSSGLIGRSGLVTLSRLPVLESRAHTFVARGGIERVVSKGAMAVEIQQPGDGSILLVNTHLASPPELGSSILCSAARSREIRARQLTELQSWIGQIRRAQNSTLVVGDLNVDEKEPCYRTLSPALGTDLFRARLTNRNHPTDATEREGLTFDTDRNRWAKRTPPARLDYGFGTFRDPERIDIEVTREFVNRDEQVSDHFGVSLNLRFN
jgi:endonuclease/exonuclease/phosphatase family metal-dependent hydrolase